MVEYRNNRLRDLREDRELTQDEAAKIAYLSKNSYIRYEKGERLPPADIIKRYAQYYSTSTDYILLLTNDPEPYKQKSYLTSKFKTTGGNKMTISELDKEITHAIERITENWAKTGDADDIPEIIQVALSDIKDSLIKFMEENK